MKRLLLWASPVFGVILGMVAILVIRHQSSADAKGILPADELGTDKAVETAKENVVFRPFVYPTLGQEATRGGRDGFGGGYVAPEQVGGEIQQAETHELMPVPMPEMVVTP